MRKPFRMIAWGRDSYLKLSSATAEAIERGALTFTVTLNRKHQDVEFDTDDAFGLCQTLADDFARNPQPKLPENKEGREP